MCVTYTVDFTRADPIEIVSAQARGSLPTLYPFTRWTGCEFSERTHYDPKDGDLCLARMKPGETLVEVRSDSDVQIDRLSWV